MNKELVDSYLLGNGTIWVVDRLSVSSAEIRVSSTSESKMGSSPTTQMIWSTTLVCANPKQGSKAMNNPQNAFFIFETFGLFPLCKLELVVGEIGENLILA